MRLIDLKVNEFIEQVDSSSPAPGGGSVSALASSLGVALARMVSHLTIGKKKFQAFDEVIQNEYTTRFNHLESILEQLLVLIDQDTEAFNEIMKAFKMPKETDDEKTKRNEAIEKATLGAIKVPYEIAVLSLKSLELIELMVDYGNKNAMSDIGVGSLLLYTGLEGAIMNVKINLSGLSDEELVKNYKDDCSRLIENSQRIKDSILNKVYQEIE